MKKILSIALALTMLLALGVTAFAADKDPVADRTTFVMGIDPEYPPFSYLGDDGKWKTRRYPEGMVRRPDLRYYEMTPLDRGAER